MKTIILLILIVFTLIFTPLESKAMDNQNQSFKEFAKEFIENGINDLEGLKSYSESKVETYDFDRDKMAKETISKAYKFLKYYFKFKKYKIKKSSIDFTDGEYTTTLYFRKNENGDWKLYKYDGVA